MFQVLWLFSGRKLTNIGTESDFGGCCENVENQASLCLLLCFEFLYSIAKHERDIKMRYLIIIVLVTVSSTFSFQFKIAPSARYLTQFNKPFMQESISYEWSKENILFPESDMIILGIGLESDVNEKITVNISGYWRNYNPAYVLPPDSSSYSLDRSGNISILTLGVRKAFSEMYVSTGVEAHYYKESWSDPYSGEETSLDSISIGPSLGIGTVIELPVGSLRFKMGLICPNFSDFWSSIGISVLLP